MPIKALRILLVGPASSRTLSALESFERNGWTSFSVETVAEATLLLRTIRFDIVLAQEVLPDGRGYELTKPVIECSGSLLVSVALSESCLWLLAAEHGVNSLGERAISPGMLGWEINGLLNQRDEPPPVLRAESPPAGPAPASRFDAVLGATKPAEHHAADPSSQPGTSLEIPGRSKTAAASGAPASPGSAEES